MKYNGLLKSSQKWNQMRYIFQHCPYTSSSGIVMLGSHLSKTLTADRMASDKLSIRLFWFSWILWHRNLCRLFNAKSCLHICIKYIWYVDLSCRYIFNEPEHILLYTVKWLHIILSNTNISIYFKSFVCTHLNGYTFVICKEIFYMWFHF